MTAPGGPPDDPGGLTQFVRWVLDRDSVRRLVETARKAGEQIATALSEPLATSKKIDAAGDKLVTVISTRLTNGLKTVRETIRTVKEEYLALIKLGDAPSITVGQEKAIRRRFTKPGLGLNQGAYSRYMAKLNMGSRIANAQLTAAGRLFQRLGVNVGASSSVLKNAVAQMNAIGRASGTAVGPVGLLSRAFGGLGIAANALGKSLGVVVTIYAAFRFIRESLQDYADLQAQWARLSVTVSDFGVSLQSVRPQVEEVTQRLFKLGVPINQSIDALTTLVAITGDVKRSLAALPAVFDIMVGRNFTLEQAARGVGRALIGDFGTLSRVGIILDDTRDALDQFTGRFGGELLAKSRTFEGAMTRLGNSITSVKQALGFLIATQGGGEGIIDKLVASLDSLRQALLDNAEMFVFWGAAVKGVIIALQALFYIPSKAIKVVITLMGTVAQMIMSLPSLAKMGFGQFAANALDSIALISHAVDRLFGTRIGGIIDGLIAKTRSWRDVARQSLKDRFASWRESVSQVWTGGRQMEVPVPTQTIGSEGPVQARWHQRQAATIRRLRTAALSGRDEFSDPAMAELDKLYAQLNERLELFKNNQGESLKIQQHIIAIDKIRADLQKKELDMAGKKRRETEMNQRIELLGNVARSKNYEASISALDEMNRLEAELIKKRDKTKVYSQEYWTLQRHINEIEQNKLQVVQDQDQAFAKVVDRYEKMLEFGINIEDAMAGLNELEREALVISNDMTESLDERIRARLRLTAIERARQTMIDQTDKRIGVLAEDIKNPHTRVRAEQDLNRLRNSLNDKLSRGLVLESQIAAVKKQVLEIDELLNDRVSLKDLTRDITAAMELSRNFATRDAGIAAMLRIQQQIEELLGRTNLTGDERTQLEGLKARVERLISATSEPILNFKNALKEMFKRDLPEAIATAADEMANVMGTAFKYMFRDVRNLKIAFRELPKGLAKAMLTELAAMAQGEARANIAWGLGETAKAISRAAVGDFGGAGAHLKSAGTHFAAAAAWSALSGLVASGAQSASQSASYYGQEGAGRSQVDSQRWGPDIYLIISGVNPNDPAHQRLIGETQRQYKERYGGNIKVSGAA